MAEPKGSLFLKSNLMNYSRPTLVSNWHQARESEPKDYDISYDEVRDMSKATYKRLANITDGSFPKTTYQELVANTLLKSEFTEKEVRKPMINMDTIGNANIDRDTGKPTKGYGSVLPRHHPDHNKYHLETTHKADFTPPYDYKPAETSCPDPVDNSAAYRKCNSQFTDTSDYRRAGRNTWQDESGFYANTLEKRRVHGVPRNPIPNVLE